MEVRDADEPVVRGAEVADADAIAAVHVAGWRRAFAGVVDAGFLAGLDVGRRAAVWRRLIAEPDPRSTVLVAVRSGRIAGFCSAGASRDADGSADVGEVYAIYADPAQLGTGVGRALMTAALEFLRAEGFTRATLWTLEGNALGRAFYDRSGWAPDGTRQVEQVGPDLLTEVRYARELPGP
ncbi:GNAT family N-acetyltransferase [Jiangella sp. DSM 45060]|uniref:GNAT family N-acetyltransferase n=1 Tax=Jiangella sp. DSM 45060 TaxID=1798224 RepID=UPI00087AA19F|nr:GNAT family N-acetyltransferase [Jiangella sp. DSM 45060]SDS30374.1 Acetyltransferase (GNAT) family protein [Jiangella sp. DSM 45060]